jgi:hypothetical protein
MSQAIMANTITASTMINAAIIDASSATRTGSNFRQMRARATAIDDNRPSIRSRYKYAKNVPGSVSAGQLLGERQATFSIGPLIQIFALVPTLCTSRELSSLTACTASPEAEASGAQRAPRAPKATSVSVIAAFHRPNGPPVRIA